MVFESYIEQLVQHFCGRWLTDFSSSNLSLDLINGHVDINNICIRTQELEELCLPLTPRCMTIRNVHIDIPNSISRPFTVQVSDVVVLVRATSNDSGFFDVRQALQSHIHIFTQVLRNHFMAMASCTSDLEQFLQSSSVSPINILLPLFLLLSCHRHISLLHELSTLYRTLSHSHLIPSCPQAKTAIPILQHLEVSVNNVHIRLEDTHVEGCPSPLALGLTVGKMTLLPCSRKGVNSSRMASSWSGKIPPSAVDDPTFIDQMVGLEGLAVYSDSDAIYSLMSEEVGWFGRREMKTGEHLLLM